MTHAEMDELYELYVLGGLEFDLAAEIDSHIAQQCEHCLAQIHRAVHTTASFSVLTDPVTPPAEVRTRLLASISRQSPAATAPQPASPPPRRVSGLSWAMPLLAAACLAIVLISVFSNRRLNVVTTRLTRVSYERDQLRSALQMLSRRETRTIQFSERANPAHGSVLVNRDGGVVLVGSDLPALPDDKTYELWVIPVKGNPIADGVFRTDRQGVFLHVAPQPVDLSKLAAVAVSVEPRAGSVAPTTKPILVVPLT